jgi:Skp family chaperone for outer membrane proteins
MTRTKALKTWAAVLLCAAAVLCAVVGRVRGAEREAPVARTQGVTIAVVDMAGVLRGSQQWRDSVEERARLLDTVRRTLSKLSREVQVLRNDYENLPPSTDERTKKGAEVEAAMRNLEQARAENEAKVAQHQNESVRSFFSQLTTVVAAYARENGIHLVLKKQALDLAGPETVEQNLQIATAEVLFADAALDITPAIVERLNAAYPAPIEAK